MISCKFALLWHNLSYSASYEAEAQGYRTSIKGHVIELNYPQRTPYSTNLFEMTVIYCMLGQRRLDPGKETLEGFFQVEN